MALSLAAEGARLALVARDRERMETVAGEAIDAGGDARVFVGDVTSEEDIARIEREVSEALGPVQILINNAGINIRKKLVDFSLAEWNSVQTTNVTSVFLMCRAFVPHMIGKSYGRIINLASIMAHVSIPERAAYSTVNLRCWDSRALLPWSWRPSPSPLTALARGRLGLK